MQEQAKDRILRALFRRTVWQLCVKIDSGSRIVNPPATPVQGNPHLGREQRLGEAGGAELAPLIAVENGRSAGPGHRRWAWPGPPDSCSSSRKRGKSAAAQLRGFELSLKGWRADREPFDIFANATSAVVTAEAAQRTDLRTSGIWLPIPYSNCTTAIVRTMIAGCSPSSTACSDSSVSIFAPASLGAPSGDPNLADHLNSRDRSSGSRPARTRARRPIGVKMHRSVLHAMLRVALRVAGEVSVKQGEHCESRPPPAVSTVAGSRSARGSLRRSSAQPEPRHRSPRQMPKP